MTRRLILVGLACGLVINSTGCGLLRCLLCPGAMCNPQYCAPMCEPGYGPTCEPGCGPVCGPTCCPAPVAGCQPACCPADPCCEAPCGPLSLIFALLGAGECWCGDGCGELYCGDYCSYPPDCRDPCDQWGNYTGGAAGGCCGSHTSGTVSQPMVIQAAPEVPRQPRPAQR